jgi:hypothetical protein
MSKYKAGITAFETTWGIKRVGDWSGYMALHCLYCGASLGRLTRSDWMRSRCKEWVGLYESTNEVPDFRVRQLIGEHLAHAETPYVCLETHFMAGNANNVMHTFIAQNPSADPKWLRLIALYGRSDLSLKANPVLPLLLIEDPAHADWIEPILKGGWRIPATDTKSFQ